MQFECTTRYSHIHTPNNIRTPNAPLERIRALGSYAHSSCAPRAPLKPLPVLALCRHISLDACAAAALPSKWWLGAVCPCALQLLLRSGCCPWRRRGCMAINQAAQHTHRPFGLSLFCPSLHDRCCGHPAATAKAPRPS